MSDVVIRIVGLAAGGRTPLDGKWLADYDPTRAGVAPDGSPMTAHVGVVDDIGGARRYPSVLAAHAEWRRAHGLRPDGRPNRPLTAFSIELESAPD